MPSVYRQFTWWVHGVLGKKDPRVIPACVVKAIRNEFPEESGEYAGFKPAEIDLIKFSRTSISGF